MEEYLESAGYIWKNRATIMHKQKRGAPTNQAIRQSILQDQLILLI